MAKGKNLNPADAFRKAQRKKELKKNKAERAKARDFALVKKDTRDLEDEIEKLEGLDQPSAADKSRLATIKSELENINKKKEEYVKEHPEQRKLVFRPRRDKNEGDKTAEEIILPKKRNYFDKNGLPRHPERSIYYDPVMNPYGVAPPGMPYMERQALRPDEVDSEAEDDSDEDDIAMPAGPPPGSDEAIDSDDDIPMPDGPPPGTETVEEHEDEDEIPLPDTSQPPLPPMLPPESVPTGLPTGIPPPPPLPNSISPPLPPGFPPLPAGTPPVQLPFSAGSVPPPPAGFPPGSFPPPPMGFPGAAPSFPPPPPPPAGFLPSMAPFTSMPAPPPGFFPRRNQSTSATQDPLSSIPHQTYQAHRASRLVAHPSLPAKPETASSSPAAVAATAAAATVSAAPQLRDLKKEATAFVPSALKRKKAGAASGSSSRVNAAPGVGTDADDSTVPAAPRPDLLGTLRNQFGTGLPASGNKSDVTGQAKKRKIEEVKKKDDYDKFVEEIGDILNPPTS